MDIYVIYSFEDEIQVNSIIENIKSQDVDNTLHFLSFHHQKKIDFGIKRLSKK